MAFDPADSLYNENVGAASGSTTITTSDFNGMLKRYLPYKMLIREVIKRNYVMQKINKLTSYKGGVGELAFQAGAASSFRYGKLVSSAKITQTRVVKGFLKGYKEIWGAMKFNYHDLQRHGDMEKSFLANLLTEIPRFTEALSALISLQILNGPALCVITGVADAADGKVVVDKPQLLEYGQLVQIGLVDSKHEGYVSAIDMNTKTVTITSDMALATPIDLTGGTAVLVGDELRIEDGFTSALHFSSLREQLLSAANGGSAQLFTLDKVKYPFLQAHNASGASIAVGNVLGPIFDAYATSKEIGKLGNVSDVIMSYKWFSAAMKELELPASHAATGGVGTGRQFTAQDKAVTAFGFTSITVASVDGGAPLKLVAVNEMRDDIMFGIDWSTIDLHSNGMIERVVSPDGNEFYTERTEDGHVYITDIRFFGEVVCKMPCYNFVIHSIPA